MPNQVPNTAFAEYRYGAVPENPSAERTMRYGKALMIILGADGQISDAEMSEFMKLGKLMGATEEALAEVRNFDFRKARLEEYLEGLKDDAHARRMLFDAIMIASADGYAAEERQSAAKAAKMLGVDSAVLVAIEGAVAMELALRDMRRRLLFGR